METLLQAALAFLFTVVLGTRVAHSWQTRSAKEARFFEASRDTHRQMSDASEKLIGLVGKRIYASQRLCLMKRDSVEFDEALNQYKSIIVEWNNSLMGIEISIKTLFRKSYIRNFEDLQSEISIISRKISSILSGCNDFSRSNVLKDIGDLRHRFFAFAEDMICESNLLHRQMHFGVKIEYNNYEIDNMSTKDLVKSLFSSRVEGQSVVRSPSDFGKPVGIDDARFGIYE